MKAILVVVLLSWGDAELAALEFRDLALCERVRDDILAMDGQETRFEDLLGVGEAFEVLSAKCYSVR